MNIQNILKEKKIKKTLARETILNILKKSKKPIDVNEIIKKLKSIKIKVDRVTVFRSINLLLKKKLINKVELNEGKYRYELASLPHHHHLVCTNCGNINDIESNPLHEEIDKISKSANKIFNFKIEEHKVEFFGKCKICKGK
jgi:Fur family transcriptional regulator, ferric uptake regulator